MDIRRADGLPFYQRPAVGRLAGRMMSGILPLPAAAAAARPSQRVGPRCLNTLPDHIPAELSAMPPTASEDQVDGREAVMIEADGLSKFYGDFAACRDVTFKIRRGEVAAFLGPNGAGKSTTMKLLTGYLAPSEGTAEIAGFNMATQRLAGAQRLGYLPENGPLYPDMTPRSLLRFFGTARGMTRDEIEERMEAVVELCNLSSVIGRPVDKLSKGFRQRLGMAQVLLHEPDVLILDEPTAGLDPNQILEVRDTVRRLGETKTILLSTHILQEVDAMCNRVIFINEGRIVFDGSVTELTADEKNLDERFHQLSGVE
jgi:ABC-2 type transport system ATP-binding protein